MASPIRSEDFEVVSGGVSDPKLTAGTVDPTAGIGVAAAEGSIYLRFQAGVGEVYFKNSTGNTDWSLVASGGGAAPTLDSVYDGDGSGLGRTIVADSGAVQINSLTNDTQSGLFINRSPGASSAAIGLSVTLGAGGNGSSRAISVSDGGQGNSISVTKSNTGYAFDANLTNSSAQALRVLVSAATTTSNISVTSNTNGATGEMLTLSKFPANTTGGDGASISMGPNTTGDALQLSSTGTGAALRTTTGDVIMGTVGTALATGKLYVGDDATAAVIVRNNASSAEVELGVDGTTGWIGTNSNHPLQIYSNFQAQWNVLTDGTLRADRNIQAIETGIIDFSVEPGGGGTNGNYLAGGAGSLVGVSAANTGRIRYNESLQQWQKSENGGAWEIVGGTPLPSTFERHASFGVNIGVSSQEATLGRITFPGSIVGLSVHAEDATTAGTLTVNVKINGVTQMSAVLDSVTNTESNFATASSGTYPVSQNDEVTIEVVGNASYDNTPSGVTGVVVNATITATGIS